jgi:hypothetical protein
MQSLSPLFLPTTTSTSPPPSNFSSHSTDAVTILSTSPPHGQALTLSLTPPVIGANNPRLIRLQAISKEYRKTNTSAAGAYYNKRIADPGFDSPSPITVLSLPPSPAAKQAAWTSSAAQPDIETRGLEALSLNGWRFVECGLVSSQWLHRIIFPRRPVRSGGQVGSAEEEVASPLGGGRVVREPFQRFSIDQHRLEGWN